MTPVGPDDFADLPAAAPARRAAGDADPEACGDAAADEKRPPAVVRIAPPADAPGDGAQAGGFVVLNGRGYNYGAAEPAADAQWPQPGRGLPTGRTD